MKDPHGAREMRLVSRVGNDQRVLRSPYLRRWRFRHAERRTGLDSRLVFRVKRVQSHHVVNRVMQDQTEVGEIEDRVQSTPQILEQFRQAFVVCECLRDFQ